MDTTLSEDNELAQGIVRQEMAAFERLFDKYNKRIFNYALRLTGGNSERAEDIAHATWVEVARSAKNFKGSGSFRGFIYGVARNLARQEFKSRKRWVQKDEQEIERLGEGDVTPEELFTDAQEKERLLQAVDQLPDRQRYAIVAWLTQEDDQATIASEFGITVHAYESLLARAKRNLRKQMEQK